MDEMLKVVEGWDHVIQAVLSMIPPDQLIDWKLLWRDPIQKWVSDGGRIVLVGDAAHPHLPTSGTGATQAVEDGATIGALVHELSASGVPTIFRAFEKLRYLFLLLLHGLIWADLWQVRENVFDTTNGVGNPPSMASNGLGLCQDESGILENAATKLALWP